jgi:hypothetical protein
MHRRTSLQLLGLAAPDGPLAADADIGYFTLDGSPIRTEYTGASPRENHGLPPVPARASAREEVLVG